MEEDRIGIPAHLLGQEKGVRIPIIHWGEGMVLLNKPQGIASKQDPWYPDFPNMESVFNLQIEAGKPELSHHKIHQFKVMSSLEPEVTGLVAVCTNEENSDEWTNAYGSNQLEFGFLLIGSKFSEPKKIECDHPIVRHHNGKKMQVSHRLGKQAKTVFHPLLNGRDAGAWLALTSFPRFHQIRLHAMESGVRLIKDPIYLPGTVEDPQGEGRLKLDWMHAYSVTNHSSLETESSVMALEPPKYWKRNLRKLGIEIEEVRVVADEILQNKTLPEE